MLTSQRLLGTGLLCLTGILAHNPALAAQWRIVDATVDQISESVGAPPAPLLHLSLPNAGAPFQDGLHQSNGVTDGYVVWGEAELDQYGKWSDWRLYLSSEVDAPPSIDLTSMQARFDGLELQRARGQYEGKLGWHLDSSIEAKLGLEQAVPITQVGEGRYTASWQVYSRWWTSALYSVNLTFVSFPEGTPWTYAPVPEASSVFMALAGLGALGLIRRRQARQAVAA